MHLLPRRAALALMIGALAACGSPDRPTPGVVTRGPAPGSPELRALIDHYAAQYDVPADLVHRVVQRESRYNPAARNGPYYGLMQIMPQTAQTMGYRGAPEGLLDAETNLKYGVKYLRGAWLVSRGNRDRAVMWYSKGYYYEAKRMGLLKETGLRT
ncbi:lytic transglycosylase [Rhodobacter veldkampii DSM 11550]|uniref:Lytic transglycosylase n=1 Tax=Phaeovulum veldkampii DSM 11550 TaxID=1185920 RepID=A0A2T4JEF3_9RHOB|nr:lytic transglycosylase domain-containing protein [Phaeovulum veldkampii]MBK5946950.1 lytic transglycosylase [Phaeovulum veldkampii DSM 11550]NCU19198.1 lytic transglycosylase domain-containing protein [Candidatus Falkowbacteria bacterium]PTE16266.1 lytic transglycosylase [Phaeovulum veldkampii DSM 11550]TDQ57477.1 transglycosylase-like protein with SLT domain [Phaeovulum veldkampii DSM 11550]